MSLVPVRFPSPPDRYDVGNENEFRRQLAVAFQQIGQSAEMPFTARTYTDATRPAPGNKGRVIFNDDDGQLNVDNGTNWTLPDGTTT